MYGDILQSKNKTKMKRYREYLKKDNINYLDYNSSHLEEVYFRQTATFFFVPELSNGTEDDVLTTLNIIVTVRMVVTPVIHKLH